MAKTALKIFITYSFFVIMLNNFSAQDSTIIKRHLNYLGSDLFEGRGTGTIGGELSAKYLALNLNKYELSPIGYENTFYQYIPMHGSKAKENSKLIIVGNSNATLRIKKDFQFYHTGGRIFTPNPIPIVFVGYGIDAPEYDYNNYKNIDVEGKIVIYFEGEPISEKANYFNGKYPSKYNFADTKQKIALSKGASGTIQIPKNSCITETDWEKINQEFYFEDISLAYLPTPLLSILINPKSVNKLFENSEFNFNSTIEMIAKKEFKSFELKNKILLDAKFIRRDFVSPNVVGYLKGSNSELNDEYLVVSAHYDHLGIGLPLNSDSLYNGVLDNSIGVAALLELAKMFSANNSSIDRSIIFLFVTGEEKGLLGSSYFIDHPPIAKNKIVANINIDGLAVIDDFNSVVGIGAEFSNLDELLKKVADSNKLRVEKIPSEFDSFESFLHSDQLAFANAGIPSILISEGINYVNLDRSEALKKWKDYIRYKYHTPFDDLTQPINYKAVDHHIKVLYDYIKLLANTETIIEWNNSSPYQRNIE